MRHHRIQVQSYLVRARLISYLLPIPSYLRYGLGRLVGVTSRNIKGNAALLKELRPLCFTPTVTT